MGVNLNHAKCWVAKKYSECLWSIEEFGARDFLTHAFYYVFILHRYWIYQTRNLFNPDPDPDPDPKHEHGKKIHWAQKCCLRKKLRGKEQWTSAKVATSDFELCVELFENNWCTQGDVTVYHVITLTVWCQLIIIKTQQNVSLSRALWDTTVYT